MRRKADGPSPERPRLQRVSARSSVRRTGVCALFASAAGTRGAGRPPRPARG